MKIKKWIIAILVTVTVACSIGFLSACDLFKPACNHTYGEWVDITNTCVEHTAKRTCTKCGDEQTGNLAITAPHSYGEWEDDIHNCTVYREKRVCSVCDYKETRTLEAEGHKFGEWEVVSTNCLKYTEQRVCEKCSFTENKISVFPHSYGEWEDTINTCTEHRQQRECSACGHVETQSLTPSGHNYGAWHDTVNTCTEHKQQRVCSACGLIDTQTLPTSGHAYGAWEDTVNTCTEHKRQRKCSVCGDVEVQPLTPRGHNYGEWAYISEDCTETRQKRTCSACSDEQTRETEARGHSYGDWAYISESCTETWQKRTCSVCSDEQTREITARGHNYVDGICQNCNTPFYDGDDTVLNKYNSTYGYDYYVSANLDPQKTLYERIDAEVRNFHVSKEANATLQNSKYVVATLAYSDLGLSSDEAASVWKTYKDDNPLYYWIANNLGYTASDVLLLTEAEYAQGTDRAALNDTVYNKVAEISSKLSVGDNAYRKALAFHDAIIEAVDYAYDESGNPQSAAWAHNILGVLCGNGAVCESYSRTFQMLLNYNGVENIFVTGAGNGESHAWNLVKLDDGNWYWCDLTWDDTPDWEWGISYYYFLVNDTRQVNWRDGGWSSSNVETFLTRHTPNSESGTAVNFLYPLPARAAEKYSQDGGLLLRQTFKVGDMTFAVAGYNAVQLVGCETLGDVVIPETVTYGGVEYTVISIGGIDGDGKFKENWVFKNNVATSISVPSTVKFIWGSGLYGSDVKSYTVDEKNKWFRSVEGVVFTKSMKTLVQYPGAASATEYRIPDGVLQVAKNAIALPDNLSKLYVGGDTREFGITCWGTYYDDSRNFSSGELCYIASVLNKENGYGIFFDENNPKYTSDDKWVYNKDKTYAYCYFNDEATEIEIPATVTDMYESIFDQIYYLESITVAEGNTAYSSVDGVLYNKDVTEIICIPVMVEVYVLPDTVTQIGLMNAYSRYNFFFGTHVREISISNTLKVLGKQALNSSSIEKINYGGTVEEWLAIEKDENWFTPYCSFVIVCSDGTLDINGNLISQ